MSKALSLKMENSLFEETERLLKKIRLPRNTYINQAVNFYNRCNQRLLIKKQLQKDTKALKKDTKEFLKAFELLEDLPE